MYSFENFIGICEITRTFLDTLKKVSQTFATVLICGESGVGKELAAKMIHYNSPCKDKNFVAINCGAIPEALLESELFGYEKGAFTGADDHKKGLFVEADRGTIFLDEIGEMPLNMQVKLLRVLEESEVFPIGGSHPISIRTRVVCATNKDLIQMVRDGTFRQDLFYRINVVTLEIPPLRQRKADIPLLIQHALKQYALENQVPEKRISPEALGCLTDYLWPGNVRELVNVMYNLAIFVEGNAIELEHLQRRPELFQSRERQSVKQQQSPVSILSEQIDAGELTLANAKKEFERLQILRALHMSHGNVTTASRHLQMSRPQVSRLIKKYGLKEKEM